MTCVFLIVFPVSRNRSLYFCTVTKVKRLVSVISSCFWFIRSWTDPIKTVAVARIRSPMMFTMQAAMKKGTALKSVDIGKQAETQ